MCMVFRLAKALQRIPLKNLLPEEKLYRAGMAVYINASDGLTDFIIVGVGRFEADLGGNHPY